MESVINKISNRISILLCYKLIVLSDGYNSLYSILIIIPCKLCIIICIHFTAYLCVCYLLVLCRLLSDTKLGKNITQQIICSNLTCNFPKVVEGEADVLGQEVPGNAIVYSLQYIIQGFAGL